MDEIFKMEQRIAELYSNIRCYKAEIGILKNNKDRYKLLTTKIKIAESEIEDLENRIDNINDFQYYCQEVDDESM